MTYAKYANDCLASGINVIEAEGDLAICVDVHACGGSPSGSPSFASFVETGSALASCDVMCDESGLQIILFDQAGGRFCLDLTKQAMRQQQRLLFLLDGPGVPLFWVDAHKTRTITPLGVVWRGRFEV